MESVLVLVLGLAAFFVFILYFVMPLIVRHYVAYPVRPTATPIDESCIALPDVRGFLREVEQEVALLGFAAGQTTVIESPPATRLFLRSFNNDRTGDRCSAMAAIGVGLIPDLRQVTRTYVVEFSRELPDGREISTSNLATPTGPMTTPRVDAWRFPNLADLDLLFRLHQQHVRTQGAGAAVRQPPMHQSDAERIAGDMQRDYADLAVRGVLKLNSRTGVYEHTVRSAYAAVWPLLPPFAQLQRWREARRIAARLRAAGCPPTFTPVDYPRLMRERYGVAEPDWGPPVRARAIDTIEQPGAGRWASTTCPLCCRRTARRRLYNGWVCRTCWVHFTLRRQLAYVSDATLFLGITWSTGTLLNSAAPGFYGGPADWLLYLFGFDSTTGFVRTWVWPILFTFKDGLSGWSPGKFAAGIRVIDSSTRRPIGLVQSLRRNLILIVPFAPLLVLLTLLAGQRLGDRWANTMVIWVRHARRAPFSPDCLACEGCTYDLTGNLSGRCPECGRPVAARQLIALSGLSTTN